MDYACPHCHELMRTDPASGQPPSMCPRCGGDITIGAARAHAPVQPAPKSAASRAPAARSLATFLQPAPSQPEATADEPRGSSDDAHDPGPQGAGMQVPEPTLKADQIGETDHGADAEPTDSTHERDTHAASTPCARADEVDAAEDERSFDSGEPTANDVVESTANEAYSTQAGVLAAAGNAIPASTTTHAATATPSFTQPARDIALAPRTARWQWAALALLALALALQVLLADRARLAADAQWRPLLTSLCGVFGCSLPTWHQPDAFTMLSRDVRPVPGSRDALLVQATFRNDARWSQAWPVMRLSLSDADGRIVGARAFVPSEYLDAAVTKSMLAPGQSAQVMLQVREPQASVVAFSFDFD